ncbi:MAG: metal-dependent phosphohydrolase [Pseudomonadota bacterium]
MFNPSAIRIDAFAQHLAGLYRDHFPAPAPDYSPLIAEIASLALDQIAASDAPYHDAEHTMMVTLVGLEIARGRLLVEGMCAEDWLHFTVALLLHDIGYVHGACRGDTGCSAITGPEGVLVALPRGATDAFLAPWHVARGQTFVRERFADHPVLSPERLAEAIGFTRFPVPPDAAFQATESEPALLRAADFIGQLADPARERKIAALFHELSETGLAPTLGYRTVEDMRADCADFFRDDIAPWIGHAAICLDRTAEGRQWLASLYTQLSRAASPDQGDSRLAG